jgi:Mce-associated membrane protein
MRRPDTVTRTPVAEPVVEPADQETVETTDTVDTIDMDTVDTVEPVEAEPAESPEPEVLEEPVVSGSVIGEDEPADPWAPPAEAPPAKARPSGKHRRIGVRQPDDLAEAEAEVAAEPRRARVRGDSTLSWAIVLAVVALVLAGLAVWFRGEANSRTEGADRNNQALTDPGTQSELIRQVRPAIEKTLSYNYTDLDSTSRAVQENLSGKALCEYDQLFGEVKKLAPEQKLVLTTQVRDIGVSRLEGNQALLLVFVDQRTTRADQNQTTASGAQFNVKAEQRDGKWKITEFDMLGQPLPNGKPAPTC